MSHNTNHLMMEKITIETKFKKNIKNVDINKIKCINNNININGNNTGNINLGNKGGVAGEEGYSGAYSSDSGSSGYGGGYDGYDNKKDKGFDCIINNNNTNTNIGGGGNQTIPPVPPVEKAKLNVTKLVTCIDETVNGVAVPIDRCAELEQLITEDRFNITVTDTNVSPSEFTGSPDGTLVTLDAGSYTVTEEVPIVPPLAGFNINRTTTFDGDCKDADPDDPESTTATGTIGAGESKECNIENSYTISQKTCLDCFSSLSDTERAEFIRELNILTAPLGQTVRSLTEVCNGLESNTDEQLKRQAYTLIKTALEKTEGVGIEERNEILRCLELLGLIIPPTTISSQASGSIASFDVPSGGTADSSELTAVEKMTKLKQQWLDLLP
jgi:hypothetical protein